MTSLQEEENDLSNSMFFKYQQLKQVLVTSNSEAFEALTALQWRVLKPEH